MNDSTPEHLKQPVDKEHQELMVRLGVVADAITLHSKDEGCLREEHLSDYFDIAHDLRAERRASKNPNNSSYSKDISMTAIDYVLSNSGSRPLLKTAQETQLFFLLKTGREVDEFLPQGSRLKEAISGVVAWARQEAIESNVRLVAKMAKTHRRMEGNKSMDMDDLFSEGIIGLDTAVEKFDWEKGFKFSTYATWWIRQSILRGIQNQSAAIRLPLAADQKARRVGRALNDILANTGNDRPTVSQIANELHENDQNTRRWMDIYTKSQTPASLDKKFESSDSDGISLGETVSDPADNIENVHQQSLDSDQLAPLLKVLTNREKGIIKMRFGMDTDDGEPKTLESIAKLCGISRERVRQIQTAALKKMRTESVKQHFPKKR